MPRIKNGFVESSPGHLRGVLDQKLAEELKSGRVSGQPVVHEQEFPTGRLRVIVIWDEWDRLSLEDRTSVILRAYELAEDREYRDRIALASGLTVREAHNAGMLPFQILLALRDTDPFSHEKCRTAMIAEGASVAGDRDYPVLRFATKEEAEASRSRLIKALGPGSEPIWMITRDMDGPILGSWGPDTSEA